MGESPALPDDHRSASPHSVALRRDRLDPKAGEARRCAVARRDRVGDALEIYARIATAAARLARARALISLDRADEALVEVEQLAGIDDDALEVRARALLALGRGDEAEAQLAEYMRVVAQRSERRVRSL